MSHIIYKLDIESALFVAISVLNLPDLREVEINLSKTGEAAVNSDQLLKSTVLRLAQLKSSPTNANALNLEKHGKLEVCQ
jgi:hypothetical protein